MMSIFTDKVGQFLEIFMDDLSDFDVSFDHCVNNLAYGLRHCEDTNIVLNLEKCHFMFENLLFLVTGFQTRELKWIEPS